MSAERDKAISLFLWKQVTNQIPLRLMQGFRGHRDRVQVRIEIRISKPARFDYQARSLAFRAARSRTERHHTQVSNIVRSKTLRSPALMNRGPWAIYISACIRSSKNSGAGGMRFSSRLTVFGG